MKSVNQRHSKSSGPVTPAAAAAGVAPTHSSHARRGLPWRVTGLAVLFVTMAVQVLMFSNSSSGSLSSAWAAGKSGLVGGDDYAPHADDGTLNDLDVLNKVKGVVLENLLSPLTTPTPLPSVSDEPVVNEAATTAADGTGGSLSTTLTAIPVPETTGAEDEKQTPCSDNAAPAMQEQRRLLHSETVAEETRIPTSGVSPEDGTSLLTTPSLTLPAAEIDHGTDVRRVTVPLSTRRAYIQRRAPPLPPSASPPPPLMPGGQSLVRLFGTITLVTVLMDDQSMTSLEELMRSLYYTGFIAHLRLHEVLVFLAAGSSLDVATVRIQVMEWWLSCAEAEARAKAMGKGEAVTESYAAQPTEHQQQDERNVTPQAADGSADAFSPSAAAGAGVALRESLSTVLRVVKQAPMAKARPWQGQGQPLSAPATVIEALQLVNTEFVIFNPVDSPFYMFPHLQHWNTATSSQRSSPHPHQNTERNDSGVNELLPGLRRMRKHVRTVINIALQTLTNNNLVRDDEPDAPLVIDQADFLAREEVHAFRLQFYPSSAVMQRNTTHEQRMDVRVKKFLGLLAQDIQQAFAGANASNVTPSSTLPPFEDIYSGQSVVAGLPRLYYGTDMPYHCQRAPVYGARVFIPSFFRSAQANARRSATSSPAPNRSPPAPYDITLCEALLSGRSRMQDLRADAALFAEDVCAQWTDLTTRTAGSNALQQPRDRRSLCDSACSFDWMSALKNEQLFYAHAAGHGRVPTFFGGVERNESLVPHSPLHSFARMVFTNNATEALYYAERFFPFSVDVPASLQALRMILQRNMAPEALQTTLGLMGKAGASVNATTTTATVPQGSARGPTISLRYAILNQRQRRSKRKVDGDPEIVCYKSNVCGFTLRPTLYRTDWVVGNVLSRCLRHPDECGSTPGSSTAAANQLRRNPRSVARLALERMVGYLSSGGKWARGDYKVCMTSGVSVHDPKAALSRHPVPFA